MDGKSDIKKFAMSLGMDLCGVAGVDRFAGSPKGNHPCDILPGCKSVIVVGARLLDGVVQINFRAFEEGRRDIKGIYGTYGYSMLPNFELTYACYAVARYIESRHEEIATPCSTGPMTNGFQISIRHSAVAAGLGVFGWLGIVLTPQFGPRNRFGVILTTLELEPDPLYSGKTLCDPVKCGICTNVCPTGAMSLPDDGNPRHADIGEMSVDYCRLDISKCELATLAMTKELGGDDDYLTTDSPTVAEMDDAKRRHPINARELQHITSHNCGKCLSYCPAGDWGKRFKATGLSRGAGL